MLTLLTAATATNSPPSGANAGKAFRSEGGTRGAEEYIFLVDFAGTGAQSLTLKAWAYSNKNAKWYPLGILNDGVAITGTTSVTFAEVAYALKHFDRVYLEITAISGTSNTVNAYLATRG